MTVLRLRQKQPKEIHSKTVCSAHKSKFPYVPATLLEYEATIDRNSHVAYVVAAPPMVPPDPFVLKLAESHGTQETYILKNPLYGIPISAYTWFSTMHSYRRICSDAAHDPFLGTSCSWFHPSDNDEEADDDEVIYGRDPTFLSNTLQFYTDATLSYHCGDILFF
jgi:hypothetical protein